MEVIFFKLSFYENCLRQMILLYSCPICHMGGDMFGSVVLSFIKVLIWCALRLGTVTVKKGDLVHVVGIL